MKTKHARLLNNAIKSAGYTIAGVNRRGHLVVENRSGHRITASSTPRCSELAIKAVLRDINRYGTA
jgi:hypothetical protein